MTIYSVTRTRGSLNSRTVLFTDRDTALEAARFHVLNGEWIDRSPVLYGNRDKPIDEWTVFKWVDSEDERDTLTVEPVTVHGIAGRYLL